MSVEVRSSLNAARALLIGAACIAGAVLYNGAQDRTQRQCLAYLGDARNGMSAAWILAAAPDHSSAMNAARNLRLTYRLGDSKSAYCPLPQ